MCISTPSCVRDCARARFPLISEYTYFSYVLAILAAYVRACMIACAHAVRLTFPPCLLAYIHAYLLAYPMMVISCHDVITIFIVIAKNLVTKMASIKFVEGIVLFLNI